MIKTYKINTYGCQMNVHESEKIAGQLKQLDYMESEDENCDIVIFNTCCIRDNAETKIMAHIGAYKTMKKSNSHMIIGVVGCMTQQENAAENLMKRFPFIDFILGANNLHQLSEEIIKIAEKRAKHSITIEQTETPEIIEFDGAYRTSGTNAWVNIMYGCNNFCTYCIVPYVRGRERSRAPEKIIQEVKSLINDGYKEITLLGQNVDSYGSDRADNYNFCTLLQELAILKGNHRIRFMTSHPKDITEEVVDIIASSPNICNYIHLPLQAGSNKILLSMNRHYTRERYAEIIAMIRSKIPDCGITTDLMVGFPGEDEKDFAETLDMVKQLNFSAAFTYIYSARKGTKAAEMEQIPYKIKSERIQQLIKLQNSVTKAISKNYEGKIFRILVEKKSKNNQLCGRTDCGRLVNFDGDIGLIGEFVNVIIKKSQSASLYGDLAN